MSRALPHYREFRRFAAPAQVQMQVIPKTLPAPTRGLVLIENPAFMSPGAALVLDNWFPTTNTIRLRGGSQKWTRIGVTGTPDNRPIISMFTYIAGAIKKMFAANATSLHDVTAAGTFGVPVAVTPAITNGNFSTAIMATTGGATYLVAVNDNGDAVLRFNGTIWVSLDLSTLASWANSTAYAVAALAKDTDNSIWRCAVAHTSPASGTFAAARAANPTFWANAPADGASWITGPTGSPVIAGRGLTQVWKYRRRLFFIQGGTMNAWYLDLDAVGGALQQIPLSGAFTLGGSLLFGCAWSVSAGDGIDDKCVFVTTEGEIAIFTGTNPADAANWRQEGRYQITRPMGKNSWIRVGGDVLIATVDGIVPISQALVKDVSQLEFSAVSASIHPMWMSEIMAKNNLPWSMCKWDQFGGLGALFVTWPGGGPGDRRCGVVNTMTGAWCRFTAWDAMCFAVLSDVMYFGTQKGRIMQADIGGYDTITDGADVDQRVPYTATCVGGWEVFGSPPNVFTVRQGRCSFNTRAIEPFIPQLTCAVNYVYDPLPPPPEVGGDPGIAEVWDQGLWGSDHALPFPDPAPPGDGVRWDQASPPAPNTRSTLWVSIGETGYSHAPIVQVQINQASKPDVEMLGVSLIAEQAGVAV